MRNLEAPRETTSTRLDELLKVDHPDNFISSTKSDMVRHEGFQGRSQFEPAVAPVNQLSTAAALPTEAGLRDEVSLASSSETVALDPVEHVASLTKKEIALIVDRITPPEERKSPGYLRQKGIAVRALAGRVILAASLLTGAGAAVGPATANAGGGRMLETGGDQSPTCIARQYADGTKQLAYGDPTGVVSLQNLDGSSAPAAWIFTSPLKSHGKFKYIACEALPAKVLPIDEVPLIINGSFSTRTGENTPPYYDIEIQEVTVTAIEKDPNTGDLQIAVTFKGDKINAHSFKEDIGSGRKATIYNATGFTAWLDVKPKMEILSVTQNYKQVGKGNDIAKYLTVGSMLYEAQVPVVPGKGSSEVGISQEELGANEASLEKVVADDGKHFDRSDKRFTFTPVGMGVIINN